MPRSLLPALLLAGALAGCGRDDTPPPATPGASTPATFVRSDWPLPTTGGAAQPDLVVAPDGRLLLSWISSRPGRRTALQFAAYGSDGRWESAPKTIAVGNAMFVNWADTPHIAATADRALWVHWLQKTAAAPYAYDVLLARSLDGGMSWSAPVAVNADGTPTEHGFVSLWPASRDTLGVAWLDGRNMGAGGHTEPAAPGGGMMTLRSATFDAYLQRAGEVELDASTCDCCQTDVAMTAKGPLLVYRDRTAQEIRDIYAVRLGGGAPARPRAVHADGWKMPACPVNGPAVAARGETVVVGWYTAPQDVPLLRLARSTDAGSSFAAPVDVDRGAAVQGRIDVALAADAVWVLWLREDAGGQSLQLARYAPDLSQQLQRIEIAKLQGRGRATGFPQLALRDGGAYVVWTDIVDGLPQLHGARVAAQ